MNKEEIQELLESAKPAIVEAIKEDVKNQVTWDVKAVVGAEVTATVKEWFKEECAPLIVEQLEGSKEGLVKAGVEMGQMAADELSRGFAATLKKNMEQSYSRSRIFKALLN